MVWYNPLSWLKRERIYLRCDNCREPLKDRTMGYRPSSGEIFHLDDCRLSPDRLLSSMLPSGIITRREAEKLYRDHNLNQSRINRR